MFYVLAMFEDFIRKQEIIAAVAGVATYSLLRTHSLTRLSKCRLRQVASHVQEDHQMGLKRATC